MSDRTVWALMQRVETLHYRAECLEKAAADWPTPSRELAYFVAARMRRIADQMYAPSRGAA